MSSINMIKPVEISDKPEVIQSAAKKSVKTSTHLQNLETQLLASLTIGTAFIKPEKP